MITYIILLSGSDCVQGLENSKSIHKVQVLLERKQFVRYYFEHTKSKIYPGSGKRRVQVKDE